MLNRKAKPIVQRTKYIRQGLENILQGLGYDVEVLHSWSIGQMSEEIVAEFNYAYENDTIGGK
jgi:hypothetical protein